jgi:hypothetical protein
MITIDLKRLVGLIGFSFICAIILIVTDILIHFSPNNGFIHNIECFLEGYFCYYFFGRGVDGNTTRTR